MQWLLFLCLLIVGCAGANRDNSGIGSGYKAPISDEAKYDLSKPIDCRTAKEDIEILEKEKTDMAEQTKAGVKMFVPASAARAILHRDYLNRAEVAMGEYNQDIDNKIKEIKTSCNIE